MGAIASRVLSWRGVLVGGGLLGIAAALGLVWVVATSPAPPEVAALEAAGAAGQGQGTAADGGGAPAASQRYVVVYVSGAVQNPGIYRLPSGLRISDAILAAGGLLASADPDRLPNLAGRLSDGKQIKVPTRTARSSSAIARVDINTASANELQTVPGIDAELAQQIVDFRTQYGGFSSVSELHTLMGLDPVYLAGMRRYLTVGI